MRRTHKNKVYIMNGNIIMRDKLFLELETAIGSNHFDLDENIKSYLLEHSDMSFASAVKIILRYYVTADVILQPNTFKDHLEKINPFLFLEVFGKPKSGKVL